VTADDDRPAPGLAGAGPGHTVLLTLRFLTELALIVVLTLVGVFASLPLAGRIAVGVAGPVLAAVVFAIIAMGVAILLRAAAPGS
jgi:hypothetical protein